MTASVFLFIIVAACVGLIANRQWELDNCIKEVIDLKHKTGGCGPEQLEELKTCRVEVKNLTGEKGKCLVFEQNLKEANSKAVVKKVDDLIVLLSKREEKCDERLHEAEIEARQLMSQIATLMQQKEQLNSRYKLCDEQLVAYNLKKTE